MNTNHSAAALDLPAPAKINRFLRVIGQRADGYHQIETQFQFLDFADSLRFENAPAPHIRRIDQHHYNLPKDDLIIRAARLLQAEDATATATASTRGAVITLHKKIPPGSGLGGGSSNAATTLLALNQLWQLGLSRARLAELGAQLGADVPLFVGGRAALASGIGDLLKPCAPAEQWLCVCLPPVQVSTAEVFAHPNLARASADAPHPTGNDLEPITTLLHREVADALTHLRRYGDAQMSGSGAAVYVGFDSRAQAEQAVAQLPDHLPGFASRACNRHPLLDFPSE